MPTTATTDKDTEKTPHPTRSTSRTATVDTGEDVAEAIGDLVGAWFTTVQLLLPPFVLRPDDTIRSLAGALTEGIVLQRRLLAQLFIAGRDVVVPTELEARRNGGYSAA